MDDTNTKEEQEMHEMQKALAPSSSEQGEALRTLEALLFAAAEPVPIQALRDRMPEDADLGGLLMALQKQYQGRGINLVEAEGHWAFRTAPDLAGSLKAEKEVQRRLSRAAMETLAIIAYHQPVTRAEIENIRGVSTNKGTLDVLIEAGWVKPGRRRQTPGRPMTWVTTTGFLDHFGLAAVTDLPGLDDLKAAGLLDRRPAIETVSLTGELFDEDDSELEDERWDEADFDEYDDPDDEEGQETLASENESAYEETEEQNMLEKEGEN